MCIHKHATMCEESHNFVDFFLPLYTVFATKRCLSGMHPPASSSIVHSILKTC